MEHDKLCINKPCTCRVDDYGHQWDCMMVCQCSTITKVREQISQEILEWAQKYNNNPIVENCVRIARGK